MGLKWRYMMIFSLWLPFKGCHGPNHISRLPPYSKNQRNVITREPIIVQTCLTPHFKQKVSLWGGSHTVLSSYILRCAQKCPKCRILGWNGINLQENQEKQSCFFRVSKICRWRTQQKQKQCIIWQTITTDVTKLLNGLHTPLLTHA